MPLPLGFVPDVQMPAGFEPDVASSALARLGGVKPKLPIQPFEPSPGVGFHSDIRTGLKQSVGLAPAPKSHDFATADFPLTAPLMSYLHGQSAFAPTGNLLGGLGQLGLMMGGGRSAAPESMGRALPIPPENYMPVYSAPEPAPATLGTRVANYGINQLNKIPFLPDIPNVTPAAKPKFLGYQNVLDPAAYGEAPVPPIRPRTATRFNLKNVTPENQATPTHEIGPSGAIKNPQSGPVGGPPEAPAVPKLVKVDSGTAIIQMPNGKFAAVPVKDLPAWGITSVGKSGR